MSCRLDQARSRLVRRHEHREKLSLPAFFASFLWHIIVSDKLFPVRTVMEQPTSDMLDFPAQTPAAQPSSSPAESSARTAVQTSPATSSAATASASGSVLRTAAMQPSTASASTSAAQSFAAGDGGSSATIDHRQPPCKAYFSRSRVCMTVRDNKTGDSRNVFMLLNCILSGFILA